MDDPEDELDDSEVEEDLENKINCPNVMMTSEKHQSGTDRVAEVANNFDCDIVVNIQGDEPGIDPSLIDQFIAEYFKHYYFITSI